MHPEKDADKLPYYRLIMLSKLQPTKRIITDYIPIEVTAQNEITGKLTAGPFAARIINISAAGSCLLMDQVMIRGYHIFHSTREDDARFLQLTINLPPDIVDYTVAARPIWMNLFRQNDIRAFKMGVKFLINNDKQKIKHLLAAIIRHNK